MTRNGCWTAFHCDCMKNKPVSHYLKEKFCLSQMLLRVIYSNGSTKKIGKLKMATTMRYCGVWMNEWSLHLYSSVSYTATYYEPVKYLNSHAV